MPFGFNISFPHIPYLSKKTAQVVVAQPKEQPKFVINSTEELLKIPYKNKDEKDTERQQNVEEEQRIFVKNRLNAYIAARTALKDTYATLGMIGPSALLFTTCTLFWSATISIGLIIAGHKFFFENMRNPAEFFANYRQFKELQKELLTIFHWMITEGVSASSDIDVVNVLKTIAPDIIQGTDLFPKHFKGKVSVNFIEALAGTPHEVIINMQPLVATSVPEQKEPAPQTNLFFGPSSTPRIVNSKTTARFQQLATHVFFGYDSTSSPQPTSSPGMRKTI